MTEEQKKEIVINNYFKSECSVNTSIFEAYKKGFERAMTKFPVKRRGEWIKEKYCNPKCSECGHCFPNTAFKRERYEMFPIRFCPHCGASMGWYVEEEEEAE